MLHMINPVLLDVEKYPSITLLLKEFTTEQRRIFSEGWRGGVCRETHIKATFLLSNLEFICRGGVGDIGGGRGDSLHSYIFPCFSLPALHIFPCVIYLKII